MQFYARPVRVDTHTLMLMLMNNHGLIINNSAMLPIICSHMPSENPGSFRELREANTSA